MRTFRDKVGAEWTIEVTIATVKRIRDLAGLDVLDLETSFARLIDDPCALGAALYAAVKPQADERGVSPDAFADLLDGEAVRLATAAMTEELADFFQGAKRTAAKAVLRKIAQLTPEIERRINERVDGLTLDAFGAAFTNSPASSASIPAA